MDEKAKDVSVQVNLRKFRDLTEDQIRERFTKDILPEIVRVVREGGEEARTECSVCNPWSRDICRVL